MANTKTAFLPLMRRVLVDDHATSAIRFELERRRQVSARAFLIARGHMGHVGREKHKIPDLGA